MQLHAYRSLFSRCTLFVPAIAPSIHKLVFSWMKRSSDRIFPSRYQIELFSKSQRDILTICRFYDRRIEDLRTIDYHWVFSLQLMNVISVFMPALRPLCLKYATQVQLPVTRAKMIDLFWLRVTPCNITAKLKADCGRNYARHIQALDIFHERHVPHYSNDIIKSVLRESLNSIACNQHDYVIFVGQYR